MDAFARGFNWNEHAATCSVATRIFQDIDELQELTKTNGKAPQFLVIFQACGVMQNEEICE